MLVSRLATTSSIFFETMAKGKIRILAPINGPEELNPLLAAGADDLYFGIELPGLALGGSRGKAHASFDSIGKVEELAKSASSEGACLNLTLNNYSFTRKEIGILEGILPKLKRIGLKNLIIANINVLLWIEKRFPGWFNLTISSLFSTVNEEAFDFFRRFNVKRVILDRQITMDDLESISAIKGDIEIECFIANGNCRNINALCGNCFLAKNKHQGMHTVFFPYHVNMIEGDQSVSTDLIARKMTAQHESCGICALAYFRKYDVSSVKLVGRGHPLDSKLKYLKLITSALEELDEFEGNPQDFNPTNLFEKEIGFSCSVGNCYYPNGKRHTDK